MIWYKDNACFFFSKIPLPSGLNSTPRQDFLKGLTIHCWSCWSMPYRWLWRLSGLIHEIDLSRQSLPINFAVNQPRCDKVLLGMQSEMKYGLVELKRCWLVGFRYHFLEGKCGVSWVVVGWIGRGVKSHDGCKNSFKAIFVVSMLRIHGYRNTSKWIRSQP